MLPEGEKKSLTCAKMFLIKSSLKVSIFFVNDINIRMQYWHSNDTRTAVVYSNYRINPVQGS